MKYAVVDIETTGGLYKRDRITEIGIVTVENNQIIDTWRTFVNPEMSVPPMITRLTGITDDMVAYAPKFYEVAKEVVLRTKGAIFVAHNVRFDYTFLREEFKRYGFTFTRRQLCTVRLTRSLMPGLKGYGLSKLIKHFNLVVENRHRALDDAIATAEILIQLQSMEDKDHIKSIINKGIKETKLPKNITIDQLHQIPEECGIYYFYNDDKDVVYVGKSKNLKKRVFQHFARMTNKASKLYQRVDSISYEITGSEIISLLLELQEIKSLMPEINKMQRRNSFPYVITSSTANHGYHCLKVELKRKIKDSNTIINFFPNISSAKSQLKQITNEFVLCKKVNNLVKTESACFEYHTEQCYGACIEEEEPEEYNERVALAMAMTKNPIKGTFGVVDVGRNDNERGIILVEDGNCMGFGFVASEDLVPSLEYFNESIQRIEVDKDFNQVLALYLRKHTVESLIDFKPVLKPS